MLLYFVVLGYNLYIKLFYVYLIDMQSLVNIYLDVYLYVINRYYVMRRLDRYWVGFFIDFIIEQVLMRSCQES